LRTGAPAQRAAEVRHDCQRHARFCSLRRVVLSTARARGINGQRKSGAAGAARLLTLADPADQTLQINGSRPPEATILHFYYRPTSTVRVPQSPRSLSMLPPPRVARSRWRHSSRRRRCFRARQLSRRPQSGRPALHMQLNDSDTVAAAPQSATCELRRRTAGSSGRSRSRVRRSGGTPSLRVERRPMP
jgi:hypothetical protein